MGIITNEPVIYDENTPLPTDPQMAAACVPGYVMANWTEEQLDQIIASHKEIAFARTSLKQKLFNEQCSLWRAQHVLSVSLAAGEILPDGHQVTGIQQSL